MSDADLIIRCDCHSPEHMVIFDRWDWDDPYPHGQLIISTSLVDYHPWWRRIVRAAEYVLTAKTKRYMWAETVVRRADAERIRDYLDNYLAQGTEAGTAETAKQGSVHDGPAPKGDAPNG